VLDRFRIELRRHKQRPFLEAVAAACALVATADGEVSFSARARLDSVVESLSQLHVFDPHEVVDAFDENIARLSEDADGEATILAVIAAGTRAEGADDLLLRISAAMSLADGRDSADEREVIGKIYETLKLPGSAVDDAYAAVRG
jgi:tellurite resistance protein TerB